MFGKFTWFKPLVIIWSISVVKAVGRFCKKKVLIYAFSKYCTPNSQFRTLLNIAYMRASKRSHWGAFECKKLYPEPGEAAGGEPGYVRRTIICWNWDLISAATPPPGCRLQIEETFPCLNFQYARKNMLQTTQLPRKVSWYYITFLLYI